MTERKAADSSSPELSGSDHQPTRRNLLVELITGFLSLILVTVPGVIGGLFYLDPILRRKKTAEASGASLDGFLKLDVTADTLGSDPVASTVVQDYYDDAWNRFRNVPVGSVWLRKQADGTILAFNSVCPHLGCSVNYRASVGDFFCPCHTSSFDLDGTKTNQVPPRDMDRLEIVTATDGKPDPAGKELWLKFQSFRGATSDKIPV